MEYKKRCFGLKKGTCTILKKQEPCETCVFYKTKEEKAEGERKAKKRCRELKILYGNEYITGKNE